jgi:hypothetical protein
MNASYLFQVNDPAFESEMASVATRVQDWKAVLEYFSIKHEPSMMEGELLLSCPRCKGSRIYLNLNKHRFPKFTCNGLCHITCGQSIVSLINQFHPEMSPTEILSTIQSSFVPHAARKVQPKKSKKVQPKKAVPTRQTKPAKATPAKATRYGELDGALFPTKHPQKA